MYLPQLELIGYLPTEKYSPAAEILALSQASGRHLDRYRNACFQTEITEAVRAATFNQPNVELVDIEGRG